MGIKDSKLVNLSYEEALKRVNDVEQKKVREAFKRASTPNGQMTKFGFIKDFLGDAVPINIAERLYDKFGGSPKGLSLKDLMCGLVLLTRGKEEERMKFLFGFYSNEPYQFIDKSEMDEIILKTEGNVVEELAELFKDSDQVSYEVFKKWMKENVTCLSMSMWLLKESITAIQSNDQLALTFYQTLAGITHLDETDIMELEKHYWQLKSTSRNGKFDLEMFASIVSPPLSKVLCKELFRSFDENQDNHIDLKELACGISACCRGPTVDQFKFCFKLFDMKRQGVLYRSEVMVMMKVMMEVRAMAMSPEELSSDGLMDKKEEELCSDLLSSCEGGDFATQGEYLIWALEHPLTNTFLNVLKQMCHICLGLRPRNKEEEASIIIPWLAREEREGLKVGQVWYLISLTWWRTWSDYIQPIQEILPDNNLPSLVKTSSSSSSPSPAPSSMFPLRLENGGVNLLSYRRNNPSPSNNFFSTFQNNFDSESPNFSSLPPSFKGMSVTNLDSSQYATLPRKSPSSQCTAPMSSSLQGESSSSTPSGSPKTTRKVSTFLKPGGVDNSGLVLPPSKIVSLTNEGGILRRDYILQRSKDFEIVPEAVWKVFSIWYGKPLVALPRIVIEPYNGAMPSLELYPIQVKLLRIQNSNNIQSGQFKAVNQGVYAGINSGLSGLGVTGSSYLTNGESHRYVAYTATFSCKHTLKYIHEFVANKLKINKEDLRLWKIKDEMNSILLEDEDKTMEQMRIFDNQQILIEVRNKDLTWPEEILKMAKNKALVDKSQTEKGATGLNNLGNTCFMNSALQCLSNTQILTAYFNSGKHLYELNRTNPLGARGYLAEKYGQLVKDLWSGQAKSIAPVKLKWTINKYAPCFNDFQQHDSQELLAFVLDRLHEDLNRVQEKPYVELKDSDGRPDEIVAQEAWENHFVRNQSILVDLFHGQLKSQVRCLQCSHTSVKFDPFTFLSLPLPLESCIHLEVIVISLDASCPVKYGLKLNPEDTILSLKVILSDLSFIPANLILIVEVYGSLVKGFPPDESKVKLQPGCQMFAYQLPLSYPIDASLERFNALSYPAMTGGVVVPPNMMTSSSRSSSSSSIRCNNFAGKGVSGNANGGAPIVKEVSVVKEFSAFTETSRSHVVQSNPAGGDECQVLKEQRCIDNDPSFQNYYHQNLTSNVATCLSRIQRSHVQQSSQIQESSSTTTEGSASSSSSSSSQHKQLQTNGFMEITGHSDVHSTREHSMYLTRMPFVENRPGNDVGQSNGSRSNVLTNYESYTDPVLVVAMHRKMIPSDYYFMWFQRLRASIFGVPLVLPYHEATTNQDLYQQVWILISRLVSPLPPTDATVTLNHAQDCDDSLKYEFPFVLKVVQKDGLNCVWCPWYRFCKGCPIECNSEVFNYASCYLAIDWEPTALHLRYHSSQEKVFIEHESIEINRRQAVEPIVLDACLRAFTKEEHLGEKELYYCSKCKKHGHAVKKLELWSLPPILVIHLKRFQLFNNRWVKSQKIVKFPMKNFDPSNYLVQRSHSPTPSPRCVSSFSTHNPPLHLTNLTSPSSAIQNISLCNGNDQRIVASDILCHNGSHTKDKIDPDNNANTYVQSPSLSSKPTSEDLNKQRGDADNSKSDITTRFHAQDHSNILYDLYAVSCHSGILGCGHYTTYAKNPNGKWYYYNDSSCKEITEEQVDINSAYLLFYERKGLKADAFLSSISTNRECESSESDEEIEKEFKKICTIQ